MASKTGNYKTRDELIQNVHYMYHHENKSLQAISKSTGISEDFITGLLQQIKKK